MRSAYLLQRMEENDADIAVQQEVRLMVEGNLEHQRFDSGKPTRELAICCVCCYDFDKTASDNSGCSDSAMLFSYNDTYHFNRCCSTCSAEGEGGQLATNEGVVPPPA